MQEIKLNNIPMNREVPKDLGREPAQIKNQSIQSSHRSGKFTSAFVLLSKVFGIIVIVLFTLFMINRFGMDKFLASQENLDLINKDSYYSIFLANGQVYFGQISEINDEQIVLTRVYYLQLADNTSSQVLINPNQPRLNLIKLGTELHGPTDSLHIYKQQVLFYEMLRDDSKVVESINQANI